VLGFIGGLVEERLLVLSYHVIGVALVRKMRKATSSIEGDFDNMRIGLILH